MTAITPGHLRALAQQLFSASYEDGDIEQIAGRALIDAADRIELLIFQRDGLASEMDINPADFSVTVTETQDGRDE